MTLDMTRGKPGKVILLFALPLMLSSLMQQLYNLCDSILVGRFLGAVALTATSSAGNLHWFPQNLVGCAINAFGIALSQRFGARDKEGFRDFFAGAMTLGVGLGLLVTMLAVFAPTPLLVLLRTPVELTGLASAYLRVLWLGFWVTALMNLSTTALMAMGDSRTPLVSLILSSAVNILLDAVFLAWLHLGVEGAALATVIAQGAAAVWNFLALKRKGDALPERRHFRLKGFVVKELLRLSLPQMISSVVINSGDLLVQYVINGQGVAFVMGMNAARRYFNLLNVIGYGLEGGVVTYVGQNWGAGDLRRIRQGTRFSVLMGAVSSAVIGLTVAVFAGPMIRFLLPDADAESIRCGIQAMRYTAIFLPGLYLLCEYRAAIQGTGNVKLPTISGFSELALRIAASLVLPVFFGREGLYFTDAMAWVPTALMLMWGYYRIMRRREAWADQSV